MYWTKEQQSETAVNEWEQYENCNGKREVCYHPVDLYTVWKHTRWSAPTLKPLTAEVLGCSAGKLPPKHCYRPCTLFRNDSRNINSLPLNLIDHLQEAALTHRGMDTGPLWVSRGVWRGDVGGGSLGSCGFARWGQGGDRLCSGTSWECSIELRSGVGTLSSFSDSFSGVKEQSSQIKRETFIIILIF